jgi:molybdopterin-containing oxidoreductase family iron-sulfur binding subunit
MAQQTNQPMDLEAIRRKLKDSQGKEFWRSLDELAETEEFAAFLEDEFPQQARPLRAEMDRRQFLIAAGASLALAGLTGCRNLPADKIVPYTKQPEDMVLGKPLSYATAMSLGGVALGLLVTSREGRPIKIEGNPDHPASLGATNALAQATILDIYDQHRSQNVTMAGIPSDWPTFFKALREKLDVVGQNQGAGLRILTGFVNSPTLASQLAQVQKAYPAAKWVQYEPVNRDQVYAGSQLAFGQVLSSVYHFDKAQVVLSLDSDFLSYGNESVRYARDFMAKRKPRVGNLLMNRLYAVDSTASNTGFIADHRITVRPSKVEAVARAIAAKLGVPGATPNADAVDTKWVDAVAEDLEKNKGAGLVVCGDHQPPAVHAICHAINAHLGNAGTTVTYVQPPDLGSVPHGQSIAELVTDMNAGTVSVLLTLGGNPVYDAPADLKYADALKKVNFTAHLSTHVNETSLVSTWHLPSSHYLEYWSDARTFDGQATICQPLILPLYDTRSPHELISSITNDPVDGYDIVKGYWKALKGGDKFEKDFQVYIQKGVIADTESPAVTPVLTAEAATATTMREAIGDYEVLFQADTALWDGRWANNGWLMEAPRPLSKIVWSNSAWVSPKTAADLKVGQGGLIEIEYNGAKVQVSAYVMPGHPDGCVAIQLGYGRKAAGEVGNDHGVDVYPIRTNADPWIVTKASVKGTEGFENLVTTQTHHSMEGRDIARLTTLEELAKVGEHEHESHPTIFPAPEHKKYDGYKWGMSIDLTSCIGCNACVIACQAENNTPVVMKDQVRKGREMHWLRIDRYNTGEDLNNPQVLFQPVMCQHCEAAPCEPVCPVAATVHSQEGLNQMVYNRCVGTRYCSNNCPYKVRRFNFFNYANEHTIPVKKLLVNPDVSVRGRGVMEKCSYCVQRINAARIEAKKEGREIADGEVQTACQASCPTQAITFGNIADHNSHVSKEKHEPQNYEILNGELNTYPRTTYLSKVTNQNEALKGGAYEKAGEAAPDRKSEAEHG